MESIHCTRDTRRKQHSFTTTDISQVHKEPAPGSSMLLYATGLSLADLGRWSSWKLSFLQLKDTRDQQEEKRCQSHQSMEENKTLSQDGRFKWETTREIRRYLEENLNENRYTRNACIPGKRAGGKFSVIYADKERRPRSADGLIARSERKKNQNKTTTAKRKQNTKSQNKKKPSPPRDNRSKQPHTHEPKTPKNNNKNPPNKRVPWIQWSRWEEARKARWGHKQMKQIIEN